MMLLISQATGTAQSNYSLMRIFDNLLIYLFIFIFIFIFYCIALYLFCLFCLFSAVVSGHDAEIDYLAYCDSCGLSTICCGPFHV